MKRYRWAIALLVIAGLLSGCAFGRVKAVVSPAPASESVPQGEASVAPTPTAAAPGTNVVLVDGELVAGYPALKLTFAGEATGVLLALPVRVGQRVKQGDLIATIDDSELRRAVDEAQTALSRAQQDKEKADADAERKYQRQVQDAEDKYQSDLDAAERKYERELRDAQRTLDKAQSALEQARMQPPTTSVTEAEGNLAQALDREAQAADSYKQSIDRPWEPQQIRDSLYKDWQTRIKERELAQLKLQDARTSLQVYAMDLKGKEQDVENARVDLADVKKDVVTKDVVEREVDLSYARAVEDAEQKLEDAQNGLKKANLYAPWDGLIYSVDASVGATVSSGTSIASLLDVGDLYFVTQNLSERHVAQIRPGQTTRITLRTYPDETLTGRVEVLRPQLDRKADTEARFAAYIRLEETTLDLLPGMTGRVEIVLAAD